MYSVLGDNQTTSLRIREENDGTLYKTSGFSDVEYLLGGDSDDQFIFSDQADVTGSVDGGDGTDIVDYSRYTTALSISFLQGNASIENFIGGQSGADTLAGYLADSVWTLTAAGAGDVTATVSPSVSLAVSAVRSPVLQHRGAVHLSLDFSRRFSRHAVPGSSGGLALADLNPACHCRRALAVL